MKIETQQDLIEAVWINCSRISFLGKVSLYFITCGGAALPVFYISFLNKNFSEASEYNSFFSDINKKKNYSKFIDMLNRLEGFSVHDILLNGSLTQRQQMESIPVEDISYKV